MRTPRDEIDRLNKTMDQLDEMVHERKAAEAADINNGGREAQLAYLCHEPLNYRIGSAVEPVPGDLRNTEVIVHGCNDIGAWGAGFVLALGKVYPYARDRYLDAFTKNRTMQVGDIDLFKVEEGVMVGNLITQYGVRRPGNEVPFSYEGFRECLKKLREQMPDHSRVHMPRIGCGLGGATWDQVEPIIREELSDWGVPVVVYDPP